MRTRQSLSQFALTLLLATPIATVVTTATPIAAVAQTQTDADRKAIAGLALVVSGLISMEFPTQGFETAPVLAQATQNRRAEALLLHKEGLQLLDRGQPREALERFQQALTIVRAIKERQGEGAILNNIGSVYNSLRQYPQALKFFQQALAIVKTVNDRPGEGRTLNNIGLVYDSLGQYLQALDFYQQALAIVKAVNDRPGEGRTLNNIGSVYRSLGQYPQALEFYQQALAILKEVGDRLGEGATLNSIGLVYDSLGQYPQALESFQQALAIRKTVGDRLGESATLNGIGGVYDSLGQYPQALEFYQQALAIHKAVGDRPGEGRTLNNIGLVYDSLGQYPQALEFYQQALAIHKAVGDRPGEGTTLNNIGLVYENLGQYPQALESFQQALAIRKAVGDRPGEGRTLNNIGLVYDSLGQYPQALEFYQQALAIVKEVGDRSGEGRTLNNIGYVLGLQKQPELAIVFYKQSVNVYESIRKNIRQLPKEQQASYTQSVEPTYRDLANLLLQQNRIMEALQVLDLLKVQELQDYLRDRNNNVLTEQKLPFLEPETQILQQINPAIASQTLTQQLKSPAIQTLSQQLKATAPTQNLTLSTYRDLQIRVQKLGKNIALFYPLILDDRLELVVFLPDRPPIRRTVPVSRKQLEATIQSFSKTLNDPYTWDVKPHAQQLYTWLIQPFAADLQQSNVQTIVYAPDGQMRYVPLAALYDGQQWLTQRFQINYLTALALTPLEPRPTAAPRILAGAYTQGRYRFQVAGETYEYNGLPFARTEIEQLAAQFPNTTPLFDKAFDRPTILAQKERYNILHFATHAAFVPGRPEDSFIVLGDGSQINLREIGDWKLPNTQLVVLSACQTAIGEKLGNGLEVLGFGYQLQRTGVRASIASLWSVNDAGTQTLMNNFYTILKASNLTETEALQKAQIALMNNQTTINLKDKRDVVQPLTLNQPQRQDLKSIGYSHPYYWAPFILIGNGL